MKELSVIVPAWNEGRIIFKSIREIEKVLDASGLDYEIIVIDDGSSDNTYDEAIKAARGDRRVRVIRKENGGKGSALKYGFNFCSGKLITFIDADLDLHPKQIPLFIDFMKKYGADVVVGSKRHPLSKIDYPLHRRILSYGYQLITKFLFNLSVRDTQAGLKLFKYKVLKEVFPRVLCKKYAFDLELLVNANHRGFRIVEAPVELHFQRIGSRVKVRDVMRIVLDTAAIFYRLKILRYYDGLRK
ncbi:MAG: glycosyltransferase family 2 protein [Candidatus Aenigmatarchaeota archaeon]